MKFQVIELDKQDAKPLGTEKELRAAVLALQNNPGFEELLRRHRVAQSMLRAQLTKDNFDAVDALIKAYGLLERELRKEVSKPEQEPREAYEDERAEYERLRQFVEIIGAGGGRAAN